MRTLYCVVARRERRDGGGERGKGDLSCGRREDSNAVVEPESSECDFKFKLKTQELFSFINN